ncbi:hypothetical protein P691DRAFT_844741 [Macrolepiota fuliginosa MF-IS2]|uniref:Uncharacterized protein n=1 Tax=Macrolepiota fuliginosa MF-IS2 TaxID=1400762 RepID=A0A9P5X4Y4_9AGAR|nr:hypothetical protein P691DRAFT_844741 [Macrolepiota fuliginosa MF-IS2]
MMTSLMVDGIERVNEYITGAALSSVGSRGLWTRKHTSLTSIARCTTNGYSKARRLGLRRANPGVLYSDDGSGAGMARQGLRCVRMRRARLLVRGEGRLGDIGTLTEDIQALTCSGAGTFGGGAFKSLSEGDLCEAGARFKPSQANGEDESIGGETGKVNGHQFEPGFRGELPSSLRWIC